MGGSDSFRQAVDLDAELACLRSAARRTGTPRRSARSAAGRSGTPPVSSRITSVATAATDGAEGGPVRRDAARRCRCRSTLASTSAACEPVSRIRARPWVRSVAVTSSPGQRAARPATRAARAGPLARRGQQQPLPGPDPATSVPPGSSTARPNGTAELGGGAAADRGTHTDLGQRGAVGEGEPGCARRPLTSQPSTTSTGGSGCDRAAGNRLRHASALHPGPRGRAAA